MKLCSFQYGLSDNIGDEIQSLAVERLLPRRPDGLVDRDYLHDVSSDITTIMQGWFTHRSRYWPPSQHVTPVWCGFHAARPGLVHMHADYWRQQHERWGVIGCRDTTTAFYFTEIAVPAEMVGCATLTLPRHDGPRAGVYVVDTDVPLPESIRHQAALVTHRVKPGTPAATRRRMAIEALTRYRTAELVITSRLHAALPCMAFGTPVVFTSHSPGDIRFTTVQSRIPIWHNKSPDINWNPQPVDVTDMAETYRTALYRRLDQCGLP